MVHVMDSITDEPDWEKRVRGVAQILLHKHAETRSDL
jgi:hypothetical protein